MKNEHAFVPLVLGLAVPAGGLAGVVLVIMWEV